MWDAVRAAQLAGYEMMRPGATHRRRGQGGESSARRVGDSTGGYAHLAHRLGHSIGVEIHEPPYLDGGSDVPMEPGMCFTNEPGIYQPGRFGLRIEDICYITEDGADHFGRWQEGPERLEQAPRQTPSAPRTSGVLRAALAVARKELGESFRDRQTLLYTFVLPLCNVPGYVLGHGAGRARRTGAEAGRATSRSASSRPRRRRRAARDQLTLDEEGPRPHRGHRPAA